ncbi:MAG: PAS domain-containing protein [Pseudomonadota bacterium]
MAGMEGSRGKTGQGEVHDLMGERMTRKSPLLEETWRYWSSLRDGQAIPRRDALEPRSMSFTLGHSMILDRVRSGTIRVRLGGGIMHDIMGMDVRGLPVRAFFDLDVRTRATHLVEQVFETPATLEMDLLSDGPEGQLRGQFLVLPLLDHTGRVTKALTCLGLDGPVTAPPRRFQIVDHRLSVVQGTAPVPQRRADEVRPMELAEPQAAFEPSPVPWLRVVK